jgi:NADPH:quinone reductase-like Zn-dependent oxidoreductase
VYCTVWSNIFALSRLAPAETLLVHGGAGGIGTAAIQLGVASGARVFATASAAKHDLCRALGAERVIDYRTESFPDVVLEATGRHGADVILDTVGASYLSRNIEVLATDGRLAIIGLQGDATIDFDLGQLLFKRGTVHATMLRTRPLEQKAEIVAGVRAHVWSLIEAGKIRTVIDRYIPLSDAAEAHRAMESGTVAGKVVLVR